MPSSIEKNLHRTEKTLVLLQTRSKVPMISSPSLVIGRESDLSLTLIDGVAGKPPPIILLSSRFTLGTEVKSSEST